VSPADPARELEARVREAAAGTPYVVTPGEVGFTVGVDLADAQWWGAFNRAGMRRSMSHEVRLRGSGTYAITDVWRELDWVAGEPRIAASGAVKRGRLLHRGAEKVWALDDSGRVRAVVDYRFDGAEGRDLVVTAADALGLEQVRGTAERVGLAFAWVGGVGAIVTVVVLLVAALLGAF
jgi:hypothetical protein